MYDRIYNFSAGPATMPEEVLEEVRDEMMNYRGTGMSVMEMSHRSKAFQRIADEADAALDAATARQVTDSLLSLNGLTRIVVTHDLDAALLRRCDLILALKGGRIVESGSFDELMERRGYFYSLFTLAQQ